ncbi:20049_t:CDS:2, partial [Racocetra fulgida]
SLIQFFFDINSTGIITFNKEQIFSTFAKVCSTVESYAMQTNTVIILGKTTKNVNGSYQQVSFVCEKQGEYNGTKELHDNGLRTRDIFSVLSSISSKYIHKHNVYNAISQQRLQKLQGLSEIKMLLKTLHNDENIIAAVAMRPLYNNECDQD